MLKLNFLINQYLNQAYDHWFLKIGFVYKVGVYAHPRGEWLWCFEAIAILEYHISQLWNNHDYIIVTIFDEKSMQQVMFDKV